MTYDGKLLARARGALERLRTDNAAEQERRTALVYRRVPEIADIDAQLRAQMVELARITLARGADMKARLAAPGRIISRFRSGARRFWRRTASRATISPHILLPKLS